MPIPNAPAESTSTGAAVVALFVQLHEELSAAIRALDADGLNFVPCAGANSIATITTHLLGSEAETIRTVAGMHSNRSRDSEFQMGEQTPQALLDQIEEADRLLSMCAPALTDERLAAQLSLPTLPPEETRPGVTWLVGNLGHAREHMGHLAITRQLYQSRH
jgi:hypothetical protein